MVHGDVGADAVRDLGGGVRLGPALYCPYRTVLGTDWSQRQVREFDEEKEAVVEAEAQVQQRLRRGYTVVE